jgi:hypothetical protein
MFFVDEMVLEQNAATEMPVVTDPCVVQVSNLASLTPGFAYTTAINKRVSAIYTETTPGEVSIFFNVYAGAGDVGCRIEVQSANGTVVASTDENTASLQVLSASDRTFLSTNSVANTFHKAISVSTYPDFTRNASVNLRNFVRGSGKLVFPNKGQKYTILMESLDSVSNYKSFAKYPSVFATDKLITNKPNCEPANPPVYRGTMTPGAFSMAQWSCSNQFRVNSTNYRAFVIDVTGLKPNTIHRFYMDSVLWPHTCNLTTADLVVERIQPGWRDRKDSGRPYYGSDLLYLAASTDRRINELTNLLAHSRAKLYNADGSPTEATQIKTNASGQARFLVFFPLDLAGWFSQDFNATAYGEQAGTNGVTNPYHAYYGAGMLKPTQGSSGYTALELTNESDSSAIRVFANRTPNKTIPFDPKGSI